MEISAKVPLNNRFALRPPMKLETDAELMAQARFLAPAG